MRSILAGLAVLIFGTAMLWSGTDGFRAFTAESARRLAVTQQPRELPEVTLQDQQGKNFRLQDYRGKLVLVTFMYTSCADICPLVTSNFQKVYQQLPSQSLGKDVVLLSISFDIERDTPEKLTAYARYLQADGSTWRMARIQDADSLQELLDAFGVVVIPTGTGDFEHNAAVYMIDRNGYLAGIYDYDKPERAAEQVRAML